MKNTHWLFSGKSVLVLLLITNTLYAIMLTYSIPKVMGYTDLLPLFDMRPTGYSYQEALMLLDRLGAEGRHLYLSLQLVLDAVYPILFAFCYFALSRWLMAKGQLIKGFWWAITLLPFLVCLSDYAENIGILCMLLQYPNLSDILVTVASVLTQIKSYLTLIYFLGVTIMALWVVKIWFVKPR